MKRYKAGLVALAAFAVLALSACNQQAKTGDTPPPAKEFGISVSAGQSLSGVRTIQVSLPEDLRVTAQSLKVFVDDKEVASWSFSAQAASVKPQALPFRFTLNTMACNDKFVNDDSWANGGTIGCTLADGTTPIWKNGNHTIKAVLKGKDVGGPGKNTRELAVQVFFDNRDRVIFETKGNSAVDALGNTWYGNDDVKVVAHVVNYTGAEYSFSKVVGGFQISKTGGVARDPSNFLPTGAAVSDGAGTVSKVQGNELVFEKSANGAVEGVVNIDSATSTLVRATRSQTYALTAKGEAITAVPAHMFRLDNVAPRSNGTYVYFKRPYEVKAAAPAATSYYSNTTDVFHDYSDGGVGLQKVTMDLKEVLVEEKGIDITKAPVKLPLLANSSSWKVAAVHAEDKLGNKRTNNPNRAFKYLAQTFVTSGAFVYPTTGVAAGSKFYIDGTSVSITANGDAGCNLSYYQVLFIKDGDNLYPLASNPVGAGHTAVARTCAGGVITSGSFSSSTTPRVPAIYGVEYMVGLIDTAGNIMLTPIHVTISPPSGDTTAPTVDAGLTKSTVYTISTALGVNTTRDRWDGGAGTGPEDPTVSDASNINIYYAGFPIAEVTLGGDTYTLFSATHDDDGAYANLDMGLNLIPAGNGAAGGPLVLTNTAGAMNELDPSWTLASGTFDFGDADGAAHDGVLPFVVPLLSGTNSQVFDVHYFAVDAAGNIGWFKTKVKIAQ